MTNLATYSGGRRTTVCVSSALAVASAALSSSFRDHDA